jgi:hypothetical protein
VRNAQDAGAATAGTVALNNMAAAKQVPTVIKFFISDPIDAHINALAPAASVACIESNSAHKPLN